MSDQYNHKSVFKEWLEKLQQESWQLELLISGFAIFGIHQARTLITDLDFASQGYMGETGFWFDMLVFIFEKGWLIFFLNLLVHVMLRGLWIGAIGLRYVSEDIDYDRFRYSDIFTRFLKKSVGSYDDFIEKLERLCSVIFAYTFLLFLLFMSFMLFLMQIAFIANVIQKINPASQDLVAMSGMVVILYFMLGSIVFFDLITLGGFKKIKNPFFSRIYFYLYRYFGFVTLSFMYRPLLYNFIDNNYTKKLFYLSIPYIILVGFGDSMFRLIKNPYKPDRDYMLGHGLMLDENFYDDLRTIRLNEFPNEERKINKKFLSWISMEQYEISKSLSSFFIRLDKNLIQYIEQDSTLSPYYKSGYVFTWFNAHTVQDKGLTRLRQKKEEALEKMYAQRRQLNREKKKKADNSISIKLDSLKRKIEKTERDFNAEIKKYQEIKSEKIKKAFLSPYSFYIDTTRLNPENSYFFTHPHFGEEGIKCYFKTDSLARGIHELKIVRKFSSKTNEISKDSIILPFIKL